MTQVLSTAPWRVAVVLALVMGVAACDDDESPPPEAAVRAIKWIKVSEPAAEQLRHIPGIVEPVDVTSLSFEIGGRVAGVESKLGDRVIKDQVLARLDAEPYALRVRADEADLESAKASAREARQEFERQHFLFQKDWVSKAALDRATANWETAKSQVQAAEARLDLARRDLRNTDLRAPFDGIVSMRDIEPFVEVMSGRPVFELHGEGNLEVAVQAPESLIRFLRPGQPVDVRFPTLRGAVVEGRISEIGSRAETANAFPVTVELRQAIADLRPGMTAEVGFVYRTTDSVSNFMVPLAAILTGAPGEYHVFVFDEITSTVRKTRVRGANLRDNEVEVADGLGGGEIIAAAGVEFLTDGQKVTLLQPR